MLYASASMTSTARYDQKMHTFIRAFQTKQRGVLFMPTKTHEERVQICISRLQEAGLLDSTRSDTALQFKAIFDEKPDPEAIVKNLLFMHGKGFNFNDAKVQQQLLSDDVIAVLECRELFFKRGFEFKMLGRYMMEQCPALKIFHENNINKDQSSNMYFGLQALESNGCFSTPMEGVSNQLKEHAKTLLAELESRACIYRGADESYDEKSIDLLPERVAANFIALRKEGYAGIFALCGGVNGGLTKKMIRVLANPLNEDDLGSLGISLAFSALSVDLSAKSSERESPLGALVHAYNVIETQSSINFIDCWKRVLYKMKFFDLVSKDNNDELVAFLKKNAVNLTPDVLRSAYARLPAVPTSEFNRKLLLLQQGELDNAESALSVGADTLDQVARNMQVALRSNQAPAVQVNWAETLCDMRLASFSSQKIAQRTLLMEVAKLQPTEARKALGLEKLDESQQATLIHALQEYKLTISGELKHLSGLLKTASVAQGNLLISYFLTDRNKYDFETRDLKDLTVLTQFVRVNGEDIKKESKDRVEFVIQRVMEQCIPSINDSWYSKAKDSDQIRQAWKNARRKSEKTEAEEVYRAVQRARESKPANVKAVSQILSDYMAKNPETAFSVELNRIFGDFFAQYTPSRAVAVQVSTPVASAYKV